MDRRRDPTIARPKEKRKRGDMSHDHVRCYNVRPWSHHVLWICEWRQQPWEPELSIATRSATAGILFPRKYYSLTSAHLSCLWKKASTTSTHLACTVSYHRTCLSLSPVACTVSLAKAKSAVFLEKMPNMPAKPVISRFRSGWLIAAHRRTDMRGS